MQRQALRYFYNWNIPVSNPRAVAGRFRYRFSPSPLLDLAAPTTQRQHTRFRSFRHAACRMSQAPEGSQTPVQKPPHAHHPPFKLVEASRPDWEDLEWRMTKTVSPDWKPGAGANDDSGKGVKKVEIDPYGPGREPRDNYKLMISAITPRFIGFISTVSKDGKTTNLAPFSYTTMVNSDPPIMVVGISSGMENKKDTLQNILDTGELTINVISEWFLEAANYTAIDAPLGVSEFALSGLTPLPSSKVKPPHVAESAFSIEAKLVSHHPWFSPATGKNTAVTIFAEGVNFHVREDVWVPGSEGTLVDIAKLKPVSRLGGIMYGRTTAGCEIPRAGFKVEKEREEVKQILEKEG